MLDKFMAMALREGATKDHPYTCPMGPNAPPLESVPLQPMLVAVGEKDLIHDTNLEYCDALRAAGKDVEVLINCGMTHSFYLNKFAVDMDPTTGERAQEPRSGSPTSQVVARKKGSTTFSIGRRTEGERPFAASIETWIEKDTNNEAIERLLFFTFVFVAKSQLQDRVKLLHQVGSSVPGEIELQVVGGVA
ncbi:hypothetical protein ZWY2020_039611 [Hordeum vulgare]|nr:hypothetical protein ZWY2020_039611 [Hordeum vulgare]